FPRNRILGIENTPRLHPVGRPSPSVILLAGEINAEQGGEAPLLVRRWDWQRTEKSPAADPPGVAHHQESTHGGTSTHGSAMRLSFGALPWSRVVHVAS